jgi:Asp-tRNA(Asn)/Glu-tRNA(Gln) amidotransferase A subunit family amidase
MSAMTRPLNEATALELARGLEAGELTAERIVRACLERIAAREPTVRAWTHLDRDGALAAARRLDRTARSGVLHGIPVGVKDIIDTADMPTGYGSPIYARHQPCADAATVALARAAGAVVLGKTVTTEFANRHAGPTTNPHNPAFSPGGSSSGSAAAVADAMVPLATGTQTGGSIIRPASYCGVYALKPSFGLFATFGVKPNTELLDTVGVMARSVGDLALAYAALAGIPFAGAPTADIAPRIGVCRTPYWDKAEPATRDALEQAARRLSSAGAKVVDVALPAEFARLQDSQTALSGFEAPRNHADELRRNRALISAELAEKIEEGGRVSLEAFQAARRHAERCRAGFHAAMAGCDVLLAPSAPGEAPRGLASTGDPIFNALWTLLHVPCLNLPGFGGPTGLPVGVQLIARRFQERALLEAGAWADRQLR